jgi:hypothetical protein
LSLHFPEINSKYFIVDNPLDKINIPRGKYMYV